eukprot:m.76234 g.76234  ORF g.76234 m.76234 type:complete len:338 (-) comp14625_c0_seq1:233-1246(-)
MDGNVADLARYLGDRFGSTITVACVSSYFVSAVIQLVSGTISQLVSKSYSRLSPADKDRWNSGVNRSVMGFALACHGMCAWLDGVPNGDIAYGENDFLVHTAATALGFFLFEIRDSLNMYLAHNLKEDILLWHHCMGVALYFSTLYTRSYLFLANIALIQEFTAVFTHIGWLLAKSRLDCHWAWTVNQYILIVTWIVCRNCNDVLIWRHILETIIFPPRSFLSGPILVMLLVFCGGLVLMCVLNPYWLLRKFVQIRARNIRCSRRHNAAHHSTHLTGAGAPASPGDPARAAAAIEQAAPSPAADPPLPAVPAAAAAASVNAAGDPLRRRVVSESASS